MGWQDAPLASAAPTTGGKWQDAPLAGADAQKGTPQSPQNTGNFIGSNITKGIAQGAGYPMDTLVQAADLAKAGVGFATGEITGKAPPSWLDPTDTSKVPGTSQWNEDELKKHGFITADATPRGTAQKVAAQGLQILGGATVPYGAVEGVAAREAAARADVASRFAAKGIHIPADAQDTVHTQNVAEARQAGYVLPPSQAKPSLIGGLAEGVSGKIKTAQGASLKNEVVTDNLVRKGLGLAPNAPLNDATIDAVQQQAGESYDAISTIKEPFKATDIYNKAIDNLGSKITGLAQKFPGIFSSKEIQGVKDSLKVGEMAPKDAVELTKALRQKAKDHLKPTATATEKDLGHAYKDASNAIEDMVEANLKETGQLKLLENFRHGRELYAKAAEVRRALTPNGHVDAKKLAARLKQGKPLTDELKTAAKFGGAFPKAAQTSERVGSHTPISALDFLAAVGSGSLKAAGLVTGRPLIRAAILSKPGQRMLLGPMALKGMSKNDIIQAVNASLREKNGLPPQEPPRTPPQGPTGPGPTNPPPRPQTPPVAGPSGPKTPEPEFYYHGAPQAGKTEFHGLDEQSERPNAEQQFSGPGGHATENLKAAEVHAGKGGTVYRVARLKNPFDATTTGRTVWQNLVKKLGSRAAANKALRDQGYDGIVFNANGVGRTELHFNKTPLTPHNARTITPFEKAAPKALSVEPKTPGKYDKYPKDMQDKLAAVDARLKETVAWMGRHSDKVVAGKNIKGAAMQAAAEKRKITGELTETERRAKEKYEKSNYQGKKVMAKGRDGVVKNMAFGKVRIVFPDGSVESFDPEDIKPR